MLLTAYREWGTDCLPRLNGMFAFALSANGSAIGTRTVREYEMSKIDSIYHDGSYLTQNPDWDRKDAPWKASQVLNLLDDHQISPNSICEVGCGSGDILANLSVTLPHATMTGFDISPQAAEFWKEHQTQIAGVGGGEA